jgi:hypothetical protein
MVYTPCKQHAPTQEHVHLHLLEQAIIFGGSAVRKMYCKSSNATTANSKHNLNKHWTMNCPHRADKTE